MFNLLKKISKNKVAATLMIFGLFTSGLAQAGPGVKFYNEGLRYQQAGERAVRDGKYAEACDHYKNAIAFFYESASADEAEANRASIHWSGYAEYTGPLREAASEARSDATSAKEMRDSVCNTPDQAPAAAPLTGDLKRATDLIDLALKQNEAGNLNEACLSLQQSAIIYQQLKFRFIENNQSTENIKLMSDNVRIVGSEMPEKMLCPKFAPETTAHYADQKLHDFEASGTASFLSAVDASHRNDFKEACRLYTMAAPDFTQAAAWSAKLKNALGHEVLIDSIIDANTAVMTENANKSKRNAEDNCAKVPPENKPSPVISAPAASAKSASQIAQKAPRRKPVKPKA